MVSCSYSCIEWPRKINCSSLNAYCFSFWMGWFYGSLWISYFWSFRSCFKSYVASRNVCNAFYGSTWNHRIVGWLDNYRRKFNYARYLEFWRCCFNSYRFIRTFIFSCDMALGLLGFRFIPRSSYRGTSFRFTKNFWYPSFIIRNPLLWFWRIPCNRIIWSRDLGFWCFWINRKSSACCTGLGTWRF